MAGAGKTALIRSICRRSTRSSPAKPRRGRHLSRRLAEAGRLTLLVLVADGREGLTSETRRHAAGARAAGIRHIVLAINKFDLVDWDQSAFDAANTAFGEFASALRVHVGGSHPDSAQSGDNIGAPGPSGDWYAGPAAVASISRRSTSTRKLRRARRQRAHAHRAVRRAHCHACPTNNSSPGREYKLKLDGAAS